MLQTVKTIFEGANLTNLYMIYRSLRELEQIRAHGLMPKTRGVQIELIINKIISSSELDFIQKNKA